MLFRRRDQCLHVPTIECLLLEFIKFTEPLCMPERATTPELWPLLSGLGEASSRLARKRRAAV